ncbi:MAG: activator of (R)-2-hydroxyglutaryl-CoA dehydratase [Candidatus Poribacteria bacterium]|nr:activator of (R)-2-hydroxyglutaryl-CoA dehydratase [Candidatus Poribacteria bacterium]MDE0504057.1 activator of (R)-2-hydroxyglutaryl-CoA dehydratase [Candidatus Poribacteria bacterium]
MSNLERTVDSRDSGSPDKIGIPSSVDSHPAVDTENLIQQKLSEKRAILRKELGIEEGVARHFEKPAERLFTKDQRADTTLLFGGLTWRHEHLIHGAFEGLGYKCEYLPTPDVKAFQLGKEFGNNGQCNPTYFTVGNLVKHLQDLEHKGQLREEIVNNYIFLTAGACGPCRFGMYEAEYRLALRNSGFDGFRVELFQQSGGLNQSEIEAGLELNTDFFLALINAMNMGDLLNDVAYQIRPYEVNEGETDRVLQECMDTLHDVFKNKRSFKLNGKVGDLLKNIPKAANTIETLGKFLEQLYGTEYTDNLRAIGERINQIEVDRTRVKPTVKITGEFWAQTTEGDGNFNMFRFLEREGSQVVVEPVGTWVVYMIHQAKLKMRDRLGIDEKEAPVNPWRLDKKLGRKFKQQRSLRTLTLAESIFKREWNRMREALNYMPHDLTDQYELQRIGHPFYNSRSGGGEGHLEVAKNIYYHNKDLCHMVLSLKPFGCMPSTQSDGAQSAVVNQFKDIIYLPIETSGEGEINAHSRVQMALGEAKVKCKEEFSRVLDATGFTLDEIKRYADDHPELKRGLYVVPHTKGIVGTAANFVHHVAQLMGYRPENKPAASDESASDSVEKAQAIRKANQQLTVINGKASGDSASCGT